MLLILESLGTENPFSLKPTINIDLCYMCYKQKPKKETVCHVRTKCFAQCRGSSVQHEESPKHCHHVEGNITQKWTRGYSERLDQRHTACNYCGNKYTSSCGGREGGRAIMTRLTTVFYVVYLSLCMSLCLPNKAPTASPAVCGWEKAAMALKMSGAPLPRARNVTPSAQT